MAGKKKLNPIATAIGITMVTGLAALPLAGAAENPFSVTDLGSGYKVAEKGKEGQCGEGKCGGKKAKEGQCGEGKCGGKKAEEGKKAKEGQCGEGKCGGKK